MKLILIRHSLPEVDTGVPANMWRLSCEGRRLCMSLARQLSRRAIDSVISSTEPKAVETGEMLAHSLGKPFRSVEGLHEHDRSDVGYFHDVEAFDEAVQSLFERPSEPVFGRETADEAHQRFSDTLEDSIRTFEGRSLAVVAHGTAISLYVARMTGADPLRIMEAPEYALVRCNRPTGA